GSEDAHAVDAAAVRVRALRAPAAAPNCRWGCAPDMARGALPVELHVGAGVRRRQAAAAACLGGLLHVLEGERRAVHASRRRASPTPASLHDGVRPGAPDVPLAASPPEQPQIARVRARQALAAAAPGDVAHALEIAWRRPVTARAPTALLNM